MGFGHGSIATLGFAFVKIVVYGQPGPCVSSIVTKGLGDAACRLITTKFDLCGCVPPEQHLGGGGYAQFPVTDKGFYVPLTKKMAHGTKMVLVTVKFKGKSWRRSYVVDRYKGKMIIDAINFVDNVRSSVSIGVNSIKRSAVRVSTVFTKDDK
jgi:hypothetical protein